MASIAVIPVVWDGLPGLPGVSVFYSIGTDASAAIAALNTWFNANKALYPTGLTWQTPSNGDIIDEEDGELVGDYTGAAGTVTTATGGAGVYAAGVGMRVRWNTSGILGRRRVRGSTFMVPLLAAAYDGSGTIQNASVASVQTASNALVASATLRVWHRNSPGGSDGKSFPFMSATVPDRVTSLRSRRT